MMYGNTNVKLKKKNCW